MCCTVLVEVGPVVYCIYDSKSAGNLRAQVGTVYVIKVQHLHVLKPYIYWNKCIFLKLTSHPFSKE